MSLSKNLYAQSLQIAKDAHDEYKGKQGEIGYLTYVTAFGLVSGRIFNTKKLDFSSIESFKEDLAKYMGDSEGIDIISIANSVYGKISNKEETYREDTIIQDAIIPLEDVTIIGSNGVIKTDLFVLFTDQIIGILPGKANQ
ncbi:hypothetical protein NST20_13085 [Weizmannia sp. FSL W8-0676]|uniref:hypothetical protein n=1 Tax=Weizmannia sp. FSL W8-0676 TaxID=2954703 RepID=UPI0031588712